MRLGRWLVGTKLMVIVVLGLVLGYGLLIAFQINSFYRESYDVTMTRNTHLTKLIQAQIIGGVRWRKHRAIERAYHALTLDPESGLASVLVLDQIGKVLADYRSDQFAFFDLNQSLELASDRLDDGRTYVLEYKTHIIMLTPVTLGKSGARIGTLGIAWSLELLQARTSKALMGQVALSVIVVICLVSLLVWVLSTVVSRPLASVTKTTLRLAQGDKKAAIPYLRRGDEIGEMARSLEVFKGNVETIDRLSAEQAAQNKRLAEALEKERDYNVLQREFVAMASHEFRTPLTIIDGVAQGILRRAEKLDPEDIKKRASRIRSAVQRMLTLIESVLKSASFDAGKFRVDLKPCNLRELVSTACMRQQEISSSHEIVTDIDSLPNETLGDASMLEQVFANLLSNAVKYSGGNPRIEVVGLMENGIASIAVRDHGLGIPADEQSKLFDRFFRASTSTGIAGTGIGLNLVVQIVELHGGRIEVESEVAQGSTFTVFIPIRTDGRKSNNTEMAMAQEDLAVS